jgi:hypothetical protein
MATYDPYLTEKTTPSRLTRKQSRRIVFTKNKRANRLLKQMKALKRQESESVQEE